MKKMLLVNLFSVFTFSAFAQITNGGFEDWKTTGPYEDPNGWATFNPYSVFNVPITATKSADAHSGLYALKLETKQYTDPSKGRLDTLSGIAVSSKYIFLNQEPKGFSYNQRPISLNGFFKYAPLLNDQGGVLVYLTKWNANTMQADTIGAGGHAFKKAMPVYVPINIPIIYTASVAMPDTALILLISSDPDRKPIPGTVLFADDISFNVLTENADAQNTEIKIGFYPNPAIDEAYIKNIPEDVNAVEITDFTGRLIERNTVKSSKCYINTSAYFSGIYFYNLIGAQGKSIYKGKFSVVK